MRACTGVCGRVRACVGVCGRVQECAGMCAGMCVGVCGRVRACGRVHGEILYESMINHDLAFEDMTLKLGLLESSSGCSRFKKSPFSSRKASLIQNMLLFAERSVDRHSYLRPRNIFQSTSRHLVRSLNIFQGSTFERQISSWYARPRIKLHCHHHG